MNLVSIRDPWHDATCMSLGRPCILLLPANNNSNTPNLSGEALPTSHPVLKRENATLATNEPDPALGVDNVVEEQQENITFGDTNPAPPLDTKTLLDQTRFVRDDTIAHLGNYLSRPVLINTFTWTQATTGLEINAFLPWHLFFNDSHIKSKLNNFARLQCNLRLKFVLNASPFYYGLLKVNYDPMNCGRQQGGNSVIQSQMPGPYIAPQEMSSVEYKLPFFWPRDYLDICSAEDFQSIGAVYYSIFEQLQSANAVTAGQITISCYAWAEDVHLAAPTSYNAIQGPTPVANITRGIAKAAGALSSIPPLAGIGSMVSAGAGMVSDLATALGFSNRPNMEDVRPVQVKVFHAFANTEQKLPLDKLALDPDNELALSPETTGLADVDEMAISEFVAHEAWIGRVAWPSSATSATHLMSWFVTPHMQTADTYSSPGTKYSMTPTRYLSRFYRYWRGSMIYRVKIVSTQYHKGRLQISWDPEDDCSGSVDTETTTITKIVDLDAEREIEFVVPFKAVRCWNETSFSDAGAMPIKYGSGAFSRIPSRVEHNGSISIFVQNQLSAPVDPSQVDVVIFARAGPDFEVAGPVEEIRRYTVNPTQGPATLDGGTLEDEKEVTAYTVGERTSSLRQLLHRTACYGIYPRLVATDQSPPSSIAFWTSSAHFPKLPQSYGYDLRGIFWEPGLVASGVLFKTNIVNETPIDTFTNCFAGYRGSVNWHVAPLIENASDKPLMAITKYPGTSMYNTTNASPAQTSMPANMLQLVSTKTYPQDIATLYTNSTVTTTGGRVRNVDQGLGGTSIANTIVQPFVSVNIPQYSNIRFQTAYGRERDRVTPSDTFYDGFRVTAIQFAQPTVNRYNTMYVSAGVDFNLFYFVCCPPLWNYEIPMLP
jgi:hypothetical protein